MTGRRASSILTAVSPFADKILESLPPLFNRRDRFVQDTQAGRVISLPTGSTADVIPLEDELVATCQDRHDNSHLVAIQPTPGVRRHVAYHFTVGRQVAVHAAELQFESQPFATVGSNGVWIAIYTATNADFTPAASRVLVGVLGQRHAHRISYGYWTLSYITGEDEMVLSAGANYFLVLCAADPRTAPAADEWDATCELRARQIVEAGANLMLNNNAEAYPSATSTYTTVTNQQLWFRLYSHRFVLENLPVTEGGQPPSAGEVALVERIGGVHHRSQVVGGMAGQISGGVATVAATPGIGLIAHNTLPDLQGTPQGMAAGNYCHLHYDGVRYVADIESALTNTPSSPLAVEHATTGDMADGFGAGLVFRIRDAALVSNSIGVIYALRDGADNTGKLSFHVASAGALAERMNLTAAGVLSITGASMNFAGNALSVEAASAINQDLTTDAGPTFRTLNLLPTIFSTGLLAKSNTLLDAVLETYNSTYDYYRATLTLVRYRGSQAAPAAVASGDWLGNVRFRGYDGTAVGTGTEIRALASEAFTGSARGSRLEFYTVPIGATALALRMTIADSGNVTIAQNLRVDGSNVGTTADNDLLGLASGVFTVRGDLRAGTPSAFDNGQAGVRWRYGYFDEVVYGTVHTFTFLVSPSATITVGANKIGCSLIAPFAGTLVAAYAYAQTAPTGQAIISDLNKNGSTVWTNQANRLQIAAGQNAGSQTVFDIAIVAKGDRFTVDIDQVGNPVAGANVSIELVMVKGGLA